MVDAAQANERSGRVRAHVVFALAALVFLAAIGVVWRLVIAAPGAPVTLTVGAGAPGSDSHTLMRELADVLERHSSSVRLDVSVAGGSSDAVARLNRRAIDLAVIRADQAVSADMRVVATLFDDYFQFIVDDRLKAHEVPDLAGLRIAIPEFGTIANLSFFSVVDHYDLPVERIRWVPTPFAEARKGLLEGRYDGLFTVSSLRDPLLVRLFEDAQLKRKGLRYLAIRQAAAMELKRPFLNVGVIPEGAFNGAGATPAFATPTATIERLLVTRADVDAEAIRELVSVLFDHRLDLAMRFPLAAQTRAPDARAGMSISLHEGAQSYYDREKPGFIESNTELIGLVLTVAAMLVSALAAMRSRFASKQKNRADRYNRQLLDLDRRIETAATATDLDEIRREHAAILHGVVVALDTDEITEEGFQSFALLWQSLRDRIAARADELKRSANRRRTVIAER